MNHLLKHFLLLIIFFPFLALAQTYTNDLVFIRGKLMDEQKNPIPFVTAALYQSSDSALVTGAMSDDAGVFEIDTKPGKYHLKISILSYEEQTIPNINVGNQDIDLGILILKASTEMLEEVVVQGEKSSMVLSLDKRIFNVGKDLANAGGTATDILRNVPSVSVDVEGNISLRGSNNVRILIDGKPSGLVSLKGGAGLQQLQGSMIERIEVITNPSARYEAEGMSGIINIVLKKERKEGINGSFDLIAGHPANYGAAANVNYRRRNLNFFINYSASYRDAPSRTNLYQELYRNDSTFITRQNMVHRLNGMYNNARGGIDYFINDKNILTASYTWRLSKGKRYSEINYLDYISNTQNLNRVTYRTQDETETEPNSEYSISYKRNFAREGHELVADVTYLDNWESSDQYFFEQSFKPDGTPSGIRDVLQQSLNDETEKQLLVQIDYIQPFGTDGKFEAGLRSSSRDMTNDFTVIEENEDGTWRPLPGLTNDFLYEENIHAVYGILGNKIDKLSYQLGVRAEYTGVTTTLRQTNEVNPRSYTNLFPSAHVTYDLPNMNAMQLSYSRRVRRPQYNDLSPFMTFSDNRNFFSGNPDLDPEFSDSYELGHIKYLEKGTISSTVFYRYTTGKIMRIRRVDERGFATTLPENLAIENSFGAEFATSYALYNWWKLDGSLNFFQAIIDGRNLDSDFQSNTFSGFARMNSRITIWEATDIQLRANYDAPQQTPQGMMKSIATLDFAISKDILKNNGTLTLNVMDVFNSRRFRSVLEGTNFYTEINSQGRLRQINLTFNYRLHQAKKKEKSGLDSGI
ncbi:outer membrane beta-barrel family protein [soil metagenome]